MSNYRPDIDGLRAIAVLAVVFFHYEVPYFTGGFVGVDIFFVISGYLISSIIFKDLGANKFSFSSFYKRRILRIFPALFTVLLTSILAALLLYDYRTLGILAKTVISTLVFASNFYFFKNVGYFSIPEQQNTLLHTWSLSVEEQFYMFFPIIIYFLYKKQRERVKYYVIFALIASLIFCIVSSKNDIQFAFYMLPTRAWEFLIGTLLALRFFPSTTNKIFQNVVSVLGLGLIFWGIYMFSSATRYPSYYALFPVLGTAFVIYGEEKAIGNKFLSNPLFLFIGKISYSLYLWHWVLYVCYKYVFMTFTKTDSFLLFVVAVALSVLSWRFVEQPFRHQTYLPNKVVFKKAFLASFLLLLGSFTLFITNGFPARFSENKLLLETEKDNVWDALVEQEKNTIAHPDKATIPVLLGNKTQTPRVMLWGDSHATALGGGLDSLAKNMNSSFYLAQLSGTVPLQNINQYAGENLPSMALISKRVLEFITKNPEIKTVILAGRWGLYLGYGNQYDTGRIILYPADKTIQNYTALSLLEKGLRETIVALKKANKKVILVSDVPLLDYFPVNYVMNHKFTGKEINNLTPKRISYEEKNKEVLALFNKFQQEKLVDEIIPIHEQFISNNKIILEENHHLYYRDDDHLSYQGARKVSNLFAKYFKNDE